MQNFILNAVVALQNHFCNGQIYAASVMIKTLQNLFIKATTCDAISVDDEVFDRYDRLELEHKDLKYSLDTKKLSSCQNWMFFVYRRQAIEPFSATQIPLKQGFKVRKCFLENI